MGLLTGMKIQIIKFQRGGLGKCGNNNISPLGSHICIPAPGNASSFHLSTCKRRTIPTSPRVHFKNFLILIEGFEIIHTKLPQGTRVVSLLLLQVLLLLLL